MIFVSFLTAATLLSKEIEPAALPQGKEVEFSLSVDCRVIIPFKGGRRLCQIASDNCLETIVPRVAQRGVSIESIGSTGCITDISSLMTASWT